MKFRKNTTFNSYDTTYERTNNRLTINHGVRHRCDLVLNAVIRAGSAGSTPMKLTASLNSRLGSRYSVSDVAYALERLTAASLLVRQDAAPNKKNTVYVATRNAFSKWKNTPKTMI